ncbi:hypothetical protein GE09DRAFT_1185492 [Coniochaeta sp. 2T2.1]|nr:hypothetical protein GE09DRAFT_1185492 [Coniochaeta sp. 2T2.1]
MLGNMDSAELEEFFKSNWANTVKRHKLSLEPEDPEVVDAFSTGEELVDKFLSSAPSSVALIRPALGHLKVFVAFFEANTAPGSDVSYLWGSLACLLKLVSRKLQALDNVPRMIKSLALKAEAFNGYYTRSPVMNTVLREVCFDIQLQLTDFITVSITHIRYTGSATIEAAGMTDIAVRLKLPGAQPQSHDENQILVQDWFNTTECKWLVIFDAVESANVLAPYWPRGSRSGRAIITSLNRSLEFDPAASGIEITSWDPQTGAEFLLFLLKKNIGRDLLSESTSALTLSEKLSGHALALQSMAGMIYEGEFSVQEFTTIFSEAQRNLTKRALIKRDKDSRVVTVHPMVQTQFRHYLKPEQRQKAFNDTVSLVSSVVPKSDMEKGQLYDSWPGYDRYLKHVINLRDIFDDERRASSSFEAPHKLCEMLVDYQRVLYEQCAFEECERTCAVNRIAASTLSSEVDRDNLEGAILSHQSQVTEIIGDPYTAMKICQQEIDIRLCETPRKEIIIAYSTCNLGLLYSTANDFPKALECLKESRRWWVSHFRGKGEERDLAASIFVYEARCMIGLNEYDKAERLLEQTMAQLLGEKHLNFGSLAYTHFCYGTLDRCRRRFESAEAHFIEAQNTWRSGDQSRLHPLNAGMMYKIGACCLDQGKIDAAIKHLKDSMAVTEFYSRTLPVEHGRNLFKLSEALTQNGEAHTAEADALRDRAEYYLRRKKPDVVEAGTEAAYDALLPIYWK